MFCNFAILLWFLKLCGNYLRFAFDRHINFCSEINRQRSSQTIIIHFIISQNKLIQNTYFLDLRNLKGTVEIPLLPDLAVTIISSLSFWLVPLDILFYLQTFIRLSGGFYVHKLSNLCQSLCLRPSDHQGNMKKCCIIFECLATQEEIKNPSSSFPGLTNAKPSTRKSVSTLNFSSDSLSPPLNWLWFPPPASEKYLMFYSSHKVICVFQVCNICSNTFGCYQ